MKNINNYYLGLDKKCSSVEHCIYSDNYYNCIECEDKYPLTCYLLISLIFKNITTIIIY